MTDDEINDHAEDAVAQLISQGASWGDIMAIAMSMTLDVCVNTGLANDEAHNILAHALVQRPDTDQEWDGLS